MRLSKNITFGFWTGTALVVGNMIGAGIFFLPASLAALGSISLWGWIITAGGALCLAYVFAKLAAFFPSSGGPYTHSRKVFGDCPGFMLAWGYWVMAWTSNAAVSLAFVSYLSVFWPELVENRVLACGVANGLVWLTTIMNCIGVRVGATIQLITAALKTLPLVVIPAVGIFFINTDHFATFNISGLSDANAIASAAALTMWAFIGLEAATVPKDNDDISGKIVARATLTGTTLVALAYLITTVVLFGLVPVDQLAHSPAPYAEAAKVLFGPAAVPIISFCILVSAFGGLNGWILVQGQLPYTLASDGLFPKKFMSVSKNKTPVFGLAFTSILITILLLFNLEHSLADQFTQVVIVGSVMTLFAYLAAAISAFVLFKGKQTDGKSMLTPGFLLMIGGGIVYSAWAIVGAGTAVLLQCAAGYLCGIPFYICARRQHAAVKKS